MIRWRRSTRDANHGKVVAALRAFGFSVLELHGVGGGCPDLLVGWPGGAVLVEVKTEAGLKGRTNRDVARRQADFRHRWRGDVLIVSDPYAAPVALQDYKQKARASGG